MKNTFLFLYLFVLALSPQLSAQEDYEEVTTDQTMEDVPDRSPSSSDGQTLETADDTNYPPEESESVPEQSYE